MGTYSNIDPFVEAYVCERLGLAVEPVPTQVVARDRHAELVAALATLAASVEQIGLEVRHLQRTEVREAEEPFTEGQKGSSAMPHKRNPILSERICGLARVVRGHAVAALENVALWHERDISHSSVERVILPDALIATHYQLHLATRVVAGLRVFPEREGEPVDVVPRRGLLVAFPAALTHEVTTVTHGRRDAVVVSSRDVVDRARGEAQREMRTEPDGFAGRMAVATDGLPGPVEPREEAHGLEEIELGGIVQQPLRRRIDRVKPLALRKRTRRKAGRQSWRKHARHTSCSSPARGGQLFSTPSPCRVLTTSCVNELIDA